MHSNHWLWFIIWTSWRCDCFLHKLISSALPNHRKNLVGPLRLAPVCRERFSSGCKVAIEYSIISTKKKLPTPRTHHRKLNWTESQNGTDIKHNKKERKKRSSRYLKKNSFTKWYKTSQQKEYKTGIFHPACVCLGPFFFLLLVFAVDECPSAASTSGFVFCALVLKQCKEEKTFTNISSF